MNYKEAKKTRDYFGDPVIQSLGLITCIALSALAAMLGVLGLA